MNKPITGIQARHREETHERILSAAERVFAEYGFEGASFSRIAAGANLPKSNIVYYFETKKKLYRLVVEDIFKVWREAADAIQVTLSESKIRFAFDHIVLTSKLIDGTFPDYQRVIPEGNDKIVEVDAKTLTSAVDRVSTISDGKSRAIKMTLNGKQMTVSASSAEAGSATEEVEVNGETDIEIGFNAKYLLDITSQIEGEGCRLTLADPASPTIIQDNSDPSALYVLMPLRV